MPENRTPSGRFLPGVSGNPGGRPKGIAAAARATVDPDELVAIWLKCARDGRASWRDRILAVEKLADRAYGKTPAHQLLEGLDPLELDEVSAEIERITVDLRARREAKQQAA